MYYMFLRQNLAGYKVRVLFYAFVNNVSGSVHMYDYYSQTRRGMTG